MNIHDSNGISIDALFPTFKFNKKEETLVGTFTETKFDLSTNFMLTEYENCVIMEIRILGIGLKVIYFTNSQNKEL